ncbi:putative transcription regulator PAB1642 [Aspergillus candidus]|uniref:Heme oxygenase-like protein n=1 Tax=Aspergillus candidus TaxID=41067 RepID=A0A2I2FJI0_ASPCN|nr:heme oxygenase-like protein [Aspergillus candidus]PLB40779.1 heme oxygenase-like protein [Aspergillus candidus]
MTLTTHLLNTHPPTPKAIAHPFLTSAGKGTIPTHLLSAWLAQDRLYAQTYIRFIGHLLSKIDLPVLPPSQKAAENEKQKQKEKKTEAHQSAASTLSACLSNILTELAFFGSIADEYGLDLTPYTSFPTLSSAAGSSTTTTTNNEEREKGPNPTTQSYTDLFIASSASPTASLLEGLVVLYATELCYLRAWRHAASILSERLRGNNADGGEDADGGALRRLIPNWASVEFEEFVGRIGEVVDFVAECEGLSSLGEGGQGGGGEDDVDGMLGKCEKWWRQVVWLEERFWPDVE